MAEKRVVLITGGTGIQGGATVEQLLVRGALKVRVLTRDASSQRARRLVLRGAEVVRGDLDDAASVQAALRGVSGVFSVQNFWKGGVEAELRQGKALADAAKSAGVGHIVYTSVDGAERNSGLPHFESKWQIEQHIKGLGLPATILRPVAFMDNFKGSVLMRTASLGLFQAALGKEKPLQLIASEDIGWFAARALEQPERFIGRTIALAGDDLTVPQMVEAYRTADKSAWNLPLPGVVLKVLPKEMSLMLRWFAEHGYKADISALRREHPGLLSFTQWIKMS